MTEQLRLYFDDLWVLVLPDGSVDQHGVCDLVAHGGRPIFDKDAKPHPYLPLFTTRGIAHAFLQHLKNGTPEAAQGRLPGAPALRDFLILVQKAGIGHVTIDPIFERNPKLVWPIADVISRVQAACDNMIKPQLKRITYPISSDRAVRIAPGRQGVPVAWFWKFWVAGNEVYATSRSLGNTTKISVHASGQIHMHLGKRNLHHLAPPLQLGNGHWLHAFELRFLVSADSTLPPTEDFKRKRAFLIDVPPEAVLILNLLVGKTGFVATELPHEFLPAAHPIWIARLRDTRPVALIGRMMLMDDQNREEIRFIRHELKPKAEFSAAPPSPPYVEIRRVVSCPEGGNVLLVVPLGKEAFRDQAELTCEGALNSSTCTINISCESASIPIVAPNRAIVGIVSIAGATDELVLKKNVKTRACLGTVTLSMNPGNLRFGESFETPANACTCVPTIDGVQPRNWDYRVSASFDGTTLCVEILPVSLGFRNSNLAEPMPALGPAEELIMVAPVGGLVLRGTAAAPESSAALEASFLLRDA